MSSVLANVLVRVIGLLANVILARSLGPTDRGLVAAIIIWTYTVLAIGELVSVSTAAFFFVRKGTPGLNACLMVAIVSGLALVPLSLGVNWLVFRGEHQMAFTYANWYSLIIPAVLIWNVFAGVLLAEGRVENYWSTRIAGELTVLTAAAALAITGRLTVGTFVAGSVVGTIVSLLSTLWLSRLRRFVPRTANGGNIAEVVSYSVKTMTTNIPAQLHLRFDPLAVSLALGMNAMGFYAVALSWASVVSVVGVGVSTVVVARTTGTSVEEPASLEAGIRRVRRAAVLSLTASVGAAAFAPIGLPLLFGSDYQDAAGAAAILSLAVGLTAWKTFLHDFSRGIGRPAEGSIPEVIGLVIAVVALPVLMPAFGLLGAATASLLSYLGLLMAFHRRMNRNLKGVIRLWPTFADGRDLFAEVHAYSRHRWNVFFSSR